MFLDLSETLPLTAEVLSCVGPHRQHYGSLLHQSPGWTMFVLPFQAGTADPYSGVLARVCQDRVHLILVASFWSARDVLSLLDGLPWDIFFISLSE